MCSNHKYSAPNNSGKHSIINATYVYLYIAHFAMNDTHSLLKSYRFSYLKNKLNIRQNIVDPLMQISELIKAHVMGQIGIGSKAPPDASFMKLVKGLLAPPTWYKGIIGAVSHVQLWQLSSR